MNNSARLDSDLLLHKRVLLAEDDEDLRKVLTETLRAEGFTVVECPNGLALAEILVSKREAKAPVDLIVSDVRMPGVSGLSILEALAEWEEFQHPPVILMTAFGNPRLRALVRKFGATLLEKPFEMTTLVDVVRGAMDGRGCEPLPP